MLSFKTFLQESAKEGQHLQAFERMQFFMENYSYFDDVYQSLNEATEGNDENQTFVNNKQVNTALEQHARNFLSTLKPDKTGKLSPTPEYNARLEKAKQYFANTDMRTPEDIASGKANLKARTDAGEMFKKLNKKKQVTVKDKNGNPVKTVESDESYNKRVRAHQDKVAPLVNGAEPIKFNAESPFSDTSKMVEHQTKLDKITGKENSTPYKNRRGEEVTLTGFQVTPGRAKTDSGKTAISCPGATASCEGSGKRNPEKGVADDAACLGACGTNAMVSSRRAMRARLSAVTNPLHQEHAAVILAHHLRTMANNAKGRLGFRPNVTSDTDWLHGLTKAVSETLPENKKPDQYSYTARNLGNHKNTPQDYKIASLKGPRDSSDPHATQQENEERERHQDGVISNLLNNGKHAAAYGVLGASRVQVNSGRAVDPRDQVKSFVFHSKKHGVVKFAAHGNHINNEFGKATGDLRSDDRTADEIVKEYGLTGQRARELTHTPDGKEKGRITTTTLTGHSESSLKTSPFVYHVNDKTLDKQTGELHVDAPKDVYDSIHAKNITHDLKNKNYNELAHSHNYFRDTGDNEAAERVKTAMESHGLKLTHHTDGSITHINGQSIGKPGQQSDLKPDASMEKKV